jgi:DNA polymerase III alpha subunit
MIRKADTPGVFQIESRAQMAMLPRIKPRTSPSACAGPMAARLGVSENTAINHCRNIYAKLDVQSRAELVEKLQAW